VKLSPAFILCPLAAGLSTFGLIVRRWDAVKPSYYGTLCGSAAAILLSVLLASDGPTGASSRHGALWVVSTAAAAIVCGAAAAGYWFDTVVPIRVSDAALGVGSVTSWVSAIAAATSQDPQLLGIARAMSSALFLGSSTAAMLLGHWFLVDPKLDRTAIRRLAVIFLASIPVEVASLMLKPGMLDVANVSPGGIGGYLRAFWVADTILTALLGLGVIGALANKGYPAVMAATGLSYLAILTAFGVDVIAKAMIGGAI
jgi:hypothetical protein